MSKETFKRALDCVATLQERLADERAMVDRAHGPGSNGYEKLKLFAMFDAASDKLGELADQLFELSEK